MTINPVNIDATRYAIAYGVPGVEGWVPGFEDSWEAAEVRIMEFAADEADWDEWGECQFTYTIVSLVPIPAPFSGQPELDPFPFAGPDTDDDIVTWEPVAEPDDMPDDWPPNPLIRNDEDWSCF